MKGLSRRIELLETSATAHRADLSHLSDEELDEYAFQVILDFEQQGVMLPEDWRDQYARSSVRFLQWVEHQAKELIACGS